MPSVEEQLLSDFFSAARLGDRTMVARVSLVDLDPRTDGIVEAFDVVRAEADGGNADRRILTVDARVRRLDGATEPRTMSIALQRGTDGRWRVARWEFVTGDRAG